MFNSLISFINEKFIIFLRSVLGKFGIIIGFSSDGEDSILHKWLGEIKDGFYIDMGSYKPLYLSNTYGFYLKGWSGICIDPTPGLEFKYSLLRSRDLFINLAVHNDDRLENISFFTYKKNPDLNTFSKERVDIQKKLYGKYPTDIIKVDRLKIQNLKKLIKNKKIHYLNVDIEGEDFHAIQSILNEKIYPWCISIEELGYSLENLDKSKVKKYLSKKGYILVSRTFYTSIYLRKSILKKLPSKYVKEIKHAKNI
jgi:hypothetical protein